MFFVCWPIIPGRLLKMVLMVIVNSLPVLVMQLTSVSRSWKPEIVITDWSRPVNACVWIMESHVALSRSLLICMIGVGLSTSKHQG